MSLASKIWAYLHTLPMSVPSRMSLWLGLGCMLGGYMRNQPVFTVVGSILIAVGVVLWLIFRPKGGGLRGLVGLKPANVNPKAKPGRLQLWLSRFMPKPSEKKRMAQEAIARAQTDPRMQAKRKPRNR